MGHINVKIRKAMVAWIAFGVTLVLPPVAFCSDAPISLEQLNQRTSVTTIKSVELDFEHPVRADEVVSYHDGAYLQHYRLDRAEQFTAFNSVVCVGLVLREEG